MTSKKTYKRNGVFERISREDKPSPRRTNQQAFHFGDLEKQDFADGWMLDEAEKYGHFTSVSYVPPPLPKRDSHTDPYHLDFLPAKATNTPYSICMGMHPGRRDVGLAADWNRDLRADLSAIWAAGVRTIVCMVQENEFDLLHVPNYIREAETFGFDVIWFPVRDVSTPVSFRLLHKVCYEVQRRLRVGHVLVHCRGGKGRTGTLVCCYLELVGWSFKAALELVRCTRKGTVENMPQEKWCEAFEGYINAIEQRRKSVAE